MELDDLRAAWTSIERDMEQMACKDTSRIVSRNKSDVKTSLTNRFRWEIVVLSVAIGIFAIQRLWAPVKMPLWWISAVCLLGLSGIAATSWLLRKVNRIDLGEYTHVQVLDLILTIKKFYRNAEFYGCAMVALLMICGVLFSPVSYAAIEIFIVIALTTVCFFLEYLWYKSNVRKLNRMQNWLE